MHMSASKSNRSDCYISETMHIDGQWWEMGQINTQAEEWGIFYEPRGTLWLSLQSNFISA